MRVSALFIFTGKEPGGGQKIIMQHFYYIVFIITEYKTRVLLYLMYLWKNADYNVLKKLDSEYD